jgi:hypothetical protein
MRSGAAATAKCDIMRDTRHIMLCGFVERALDVLVTEIVLTLEAAYSNQSAVN